MPAILIQKLRDETSLESGKRSSHRPALITLGTLYFMMGFITCLNDSLVPFFKEGFVLTYTESALIQFYFFLAYGVVSMPAGRIVECIGYPNGMILGFLVAALGAILFLPAALFHRYTIFLLALFILAIGIVILQVAANPYITILGRPQTASSRLSLIQAIGSAGTTAAPVFGAYFILSGIENKSAGRALMFPYAGIALTMLGIAGIIYFLKLPDIKNSGRKEEGTTAVKDLFAFRNLNFGFIAIFLYVGAEVSIGSFLTNYISDTLRVPLNAASGLVAFYWGGMLAGRFIGAALLKYIRPSKALRYTAAMAALMVIASLSTSGHTSIWLMISVGLCNSIMFAVIFSMAVSGLGRHTTMASGMLSTAIVGGAVISLLTGFLKDHYSWSIAFLIPVLCYLYILFYGINGFKSGFSKIS